MADGADGWDEIGRRIAAEVDGLDGAGRVVWEEVVDLDPGGHRFDRGSGLLAFTDYYDGRSKHRSDQ